ncbi:MAG TPA: hypothetical protein VM299_05125 [Solirubrobacteraceae bacterium]|nr:hypothetical protein [Solirubrobacteraceae bacterium]
MALLLRDREASPEAAAQPGGDPRVLVPDFACETCGAAMVAGQDWCLECGTAARGRLGARPGWRAASTVVGLTLLLVCGAVMASYAALTSEAERTASAPAAGNGAPIVAQAPGVPGPASTTIQPGATGPGTTPPAVTTGPAAGLPGAPAAPGARPVIPTTRPATPATNTPLTPPAGPSTRAGVSPSPQSTAQSSAPSRSTARPPATGGRPQQGTSAASVTPQVIALKSGAARTYDPAKRAGAEFGPGANAVDGKANTVWDVTVPADGKPIGAGLLVDLGQPYALESLRLATPTPGFRVELYGAVGKEVPEDILDKRWHHLTDDKSVADGKAISLKGKGDADKYRLFLVYVTAAAEPADPRVAIGEVTLRGTP